MSDNSERVRFHLSESVNKWVDSLEAAESKVDWALKEIEKLKEDQKKFSEECNKKYQTIIDYVQKRPV